MRPRLIAPEPKEEGGHIRPWWLELSEGRNREPYCRQDEHKGCRMYGNLEQRDRHTNGTCSLGDRLRSRTKKGRKSEGETKEIKKHLSTNKQKSMMGDMDSIGRRHTSFSIWMGGLKYSNKVASWPGLRLTPSVSISSILGSWLTPKQSGIPTYGYQNNEKK